MCTWPVVISVSTATRLRGSWVSMASRIASLIWSAILSGWPSVTDSEVKRRRGTRYSLRSAAGRGGHARVVGGPAPEVTGVHRQVVGAAAPGGTGGSVGRRQEAGHGGPDAGRHGVLAA